jgi:hypothetical protein
MRREILGVVLSTALMACGSVAAPPASAAHVSVGVGVNFGPPAPIYEAVPAPRPGWVWVNGYWKWNGHRYVWRSGYWVRARPGYRYYPGSWVHEGPVWRFHVGYWGR